MPTLALSRMVLQFRPTTRDATGLATATHPTHQVMAPRLWRYCGKFEVKDGGSVGKAWALVLIDDGALVAAGAGSDPDVRLAPDAPILDTAISAQQRTRAQTWLDGSDLAVTVTVGMTWRQLLAAIGTALGHSVDFVLRLRLT